MEVEMDIRILGKTGLKVASVGFGGIPIQRTNQEAVNDIIDAMIEEGINFIDTAVAYTVSEEYLGNALDGKRDKFIIATKSPSRDYEGMKKDIENSLKMLKTDYIDLYQAHNVGSESDYEKLMNGGYKAMVEAKNEGKIKSIGITAHSLDLLEAHIHDMPFETIQFPYNLVERQGEGLFEKAKANNIGVIIMKPIAGGALEDGRLSIKFILQNPNVSVVIPGMETVELVKENAKNALDIKPLTAEEEEKIDELVKSLGSQFCRRCMYCMPCPKEINIPGQFIIEGYYKRYKIEGWGADRYKGQSVDASDCIQCGACEPKCPYGLPIREMLKEVVKTFENV